MTEPNYDAIDEAELLNEVERIAGPRFRRMEERADGRALMTWKGVLAHTDVEISPDNLTVMAATLIDERAGWIAFLTREEPDQADDFLEYYMGE